MSAQNPSKPTSPNPNSKLLKNGLIGAVGFSLPPNLTIPEGMGALLVLVPAAEISGKNPVQIQNDTGLLWHVGDGQGAWFS